MKIYEVSNCNGSLIEGEEINQFEAFAVEGQIPNPKKRI